MKLVKTIENKCPENDSRFTLQRFSILLVIGLVHGALVFGLNKEAKAQTPESVSVTASIPEWPEPARDGEGNPIPPDIAERNRVADLLRPLVREKDFKSLEAMFTEARDSKRLMPDGERYLENYYGSLPGILREEGIKAGEPELAFYEEWKNLYPDSPAPLCLLAEAHINLGWDSRGSKYAVDVTDEGWTGFGKHLNLAEPYLRSAEGLEIKDAQVYANLIVLSTGQSYGKTRIEAYFQRGIAIDPLHLSLYTRYAIYLLPRWFGKPGELESFAARAADQIGGAGGDAIYTRIARSTYNYVWGPTFSGQHHFDWPRIRRGYAELRRQFPDCPKYFSQEAELAASLGMEKDFDWASEQLGPTWRAYYLGDADQEVVRKNYDPARGPFLGAITTGNLETLRRLIEEGADVQRPDSRGVTPLYTAVNYDQGLAMELLLKHGADPNVPDDRGWTPFATAIFRGYEIMVQSMIDHGANIDRQDSNGYTPVHLAVFYDQLEILKSLMKAGANPDIRNTSDWNALGTAIHGDKFGMIESLIQHGADLNGQDSRGYTPVYLAVINGKGSALESLLKAGADPNIGDNKGWTPLGAAVYHGHISLADKLLRYGADASLPKTQSAPFYVAIESGRPEFLRLLIREGADHAMRIPYFGTPLQFAVRKGNFEAARELISGGADPNLFSPTEPDGSPAASEPPLSLAAMAADFKMMDLLLEHGADVNLIGLKGNTPLICAAMQPNPKVVEILIAAGADLRSRNIVGDRALDVAQRHQFLSVIQRLKEGNQANPIDEASNSL